MPQSEPVMPKTVSSSGRMMAMKQLIADQIVQCDLFHIADRQKADLVIFVTFKTESLVHGKDADAVVHVKVSQDRIHLLFVFAGF